MKEKSPRIATTLLKKLATGIALGTFLLTSPITIAPQKSAYAETKQEEKKEQSELEKKIDTALETYNLGVSGDNINDLLQLTTMGFRGEALHSIQTVSKVTIASSTDISGKKPGYKISNFGNNINEIKILEQTKNRY